MSNVIRIATRKSPLALWQAEHVVHRLQKDFPGIKSELVRLSTRGDKILDAPLAKVGGKGLFVKELEQCLLEGGADIAVHSMKDVPVEFPQGLHIGAILKRQDPRDAFVSNKYSAHTDIETGAIIGTSSLRRQCQLKALFPDCKIVSLRGNVNTRLDKLDRGDYDAILLASAGLKRLGLERRITEILDLSVCLPAIGQGAIGIECRIDDRRIADFLTVLHDPDTDIRIRAERGMNNRLNGGCQVPIAGFAELLDDEVRLRGIVGRPDGSQLITGEICGSVESPEKLGCALAEDLLSRGADRILEEVFGT